MRATPPRAYVSSGGVALMAALLASSSGCANHPLHGVRLKPPGSRHEYEIQDRAGGIGLGQLPRFWPVLVQPGPWEDLTLTRGPHGFAKTGGVWKRASEGRPSESMPWERIEYDEELGCYRGIYAGGAAFALCQDDGTPLTRPLEPGSFLVGKAGKEHTFVVTKPGGHVESAFRLDGGDLTPLITPERARFVTVGGKEAFGPALEEKGRRSPRWTVMVRGAPASFSFAWSTSEPRPVLFRLPGGEARLAGWILKSPWGKKEPSFASADRLLDKSKWIPEGDYVSFCQACGPEGGPHPTRGYWTRDWRKFWWVVREPVDRGRGRHESWDSETADREEAERRVAALIAREHAIAAARQRAPIGSEGAPSAEALSYLRTLWRGEGFDPDCLETVEAAVLCEHLLAPEVNDYAARQEAAPLIAAQRARAAPKDRGAWDVRRLRLLAATSRADLGGTYARASAARALEIARGEAEPGDPFYAACLTKYAIECFERLELALEEAERLWRAGNAEALAPLVHLRVTLLLSSTHRPFVVALDRLIEESGVTLSEADAEARSGALTRITQTEAKVAAALRTRANRAQAREARRREAAALTKRWLGARPRLLLSEPEARDLFPELGADYRRLLVADVLEHHFTTQGQLPTSLGDRNLVFWLDRYFESTTVGLLEATRSLEYDSLRNEDVQVAVGASKVPALELLDELKGRRYWLGLRSYRVALRFPDQEVLTQLELKLAPNPGIEAQAGRSKDATTQAAVQLVRADRRARQRKAELAARAQWSTSTPNYSGRGNLTSASRYASEINSAFNHYTNERLHRYRLAAIRAGYDP